MADYIHAGGVTGATLTPWNDLLAGEEPEPVASKVTLLSGQNLAMGAVLGKITASGKYTLSTAAAGDGSQVPSVILAHDCDASAGDRECLVYERGTFNQDALTLGAGHTASSIRDGLRGLGIYLRSNVKA